MVCNKENVASLVLFSDLSLVVMRRKQTAVTVFLSLVFM